MKVPTQDVSVSVKRKVSIWKRVFIWYRALRRLNKIALWVLIASIPLGFIAANLARPAYRSWRQNNALVIAQNCILRNDANGAFSAFRQALRIDPRNPRVWRQLGTFLEAQSSPETIFVLERLIQLEPGVVENRYHAAEAALALGDEERAMSELANVSPSDRKSARYRLLNAKIALTGGNLSVAEGELASLVQSEPSNSEAVFRLDQVRLLLPASSDRAAAEQRMRVVASGKDARAMEAQRMLARFYATTNDMPMAARAAEVLVESDNASFEDWMLFLNIEFATSSLSLPNSIEKMRAWVLAHPQELPKAAAYFIQLDMARQTRDWLASAAADRLDEPQIKSARFSLAIADRDWDEVFSLLQSGAQAVPADTVRKVSDTYRAFRANHPEAINSWSELVLSAKGNLTLLDSLRQLAVAWEWEDAQEKTLWAIGDVVPENPAVWKALLPLVQSDNNAPDLARAFGALVSAEPSNRAAINRWIQLQFLLNLGAKNELLKAARANLDAAPKNAAFQMTSALLLADTDHGSEAFALVQSMDEKSRQDPACAPYLAYVYARAKKPAEARAALANIPSGGKLLDEEMALGERARAIIEGREDSVEKIPVKTDDASAQQLLKQLERDRATDGRSSSDELLKELKRSNSPDAGAARQLDSLRKEMRQEAATPSQ